MEIKDLRLDKETKEALIKAITTEEPAKPPIEIITMKEYRKRESRKSNPALY